MPPAVTLRAVASTDLPTLFAHQTDREACRLAAFPSRPHDAFLAHWQKVLADPANTACTILCAGHVAGHIGAWTDPASCERLVGYWIGREYWGRGLATVALAQFLARETARPLTARVAAHNPASVRVLQKCGFVRSGEDRSKNPDGSPFVELVFTLGAGAA